MLKIEEDSATNTASRSDVASVSSTAAQVVAPASREAVEAGATQCAVITTVAADPAALQRGSGAPSRFSALACGWMVTLAALVASVACVRLASLPAPEFVANVIVDDAYYYLQPARNLLAGHGYSFDGEKRTNGVQPLWAVLAIGVVALISDPMAAGRALVILGGACWIFAGVLLYRLLARWSPAAGLLAASAWLMTALVNRLAFQGMENGLHALLLVAIVTVVVDRMVRRRECGAWRFWLTLGLLLGLITLARVDSGLLALLMGAAVLCGLVRADGGSGLAFRPWSALLLAMPGALLVGGLVVLNQLYFGSAMPVSGRVKLLLESQWGAPGGPLALLAQHGRLLYDLSTHALTDQVSAAASVWLQVSGLERWLSRGLAVCVPIGLLLLVVGRRALLAHAPPALRWALAAVALFIGLRSLIYALQLPHFTPYCTWYFGPDLLLLCTAYAIAAIAILRLAGGTRGCGEGVLAAPAALLLAAPLILASVGPAIRPPAAAGLPSPFLRASEWMNERLPVGSKVGAFSAGIVSWHAPRQQIINLDGLMNDRQYMLDYLKPGRVHQYVLDREIEFIADYQPVKNWAGRTMWGVDLSEFDLVRWWRLPGDLAYAVWRRRAVAQDGWTDPLSNLQFAAEASAAFRLVSDEQLASAMAGGHGAGLRVCGAVVAGPCDVRHILLTDEQYAAQELDPLRLDIARRLDVEFGGCVRLLGVELQHSRVRRGECVVLTRFWQCTGAPQALAAARLETWISPEFPEQREQTPAERQMIHSTTGALGSRDLSLWRPGEVMIDTVRVAVPADAAPGHYPIRVGIWHPRAGWLPRGDAAQPGASHLAHVASVTVAP